MSARFVRCCFAFLLLILPLCCLASSRPTDTIALWDCVKMQHGKDVQLYAFRPENPNGISVIVCPGGSYHWLDQEVEGFKVGEWLSDNVNMMAISWYI